MSLRKAANRWRPDEEVSNCMRCQVKFSFFVRKHHCRQCGDIFCAQCSSKKRIVPIVHPTEPQRVCERCYHMGRGGSSSAAAVSPGIGSSQPVGGVGGVGGAPTMILSSPQPPTTTGGNSSAAGSRRGSSLNNNINNPTPTLPLYQQQPPSSSNSSVVAGGTAGMAQPPGPPPPPVPSYFSSRGTSPTHGGQGSQSPQVQFDDNNNSNNNHNNSGSNHPQSSGRSAGTNGPYIATVRTLPSPEANTGAFPLGPGGMPIGPDGEAIILGDNFAESSDEEEGTAPGYGYCDGDEEDSDRDGTPPSMKPVIVSENAHFSENATHTNNTSIGGALSFMAALEDATRTRQHSLPVLLYVMQGQEMPIVAAVESADELCEDMIARLTPKWWELKYGLRKRPKGDDLEVLRSNLQFVNESGNPIPKDIPVSDLCRRQERVVLSTLDTVIQQQKKQNTTHSTRSLEVQSGFFMKSERSDESEEDGLMMC